METYHTQDEVLREYLEHLLSKQALEDKQQTQPEQDQTEPIFSD